ncbi:zinc finger and SCAN domain-containing protein 12-like [Lutzomyia longipalpis]|uniref:zinc finger and SCAN domain-containing protein 12-like n=1 Tax=Lutzomyia longipalpis TaxID=7200 RepID=UPI0024834ACF|nr:zinc finger and SCAN domain-containing protein 12-like [Lutzomyia longipalpis]
MNKIKQEVDEDGEEFNLKKVKKERPDYLYPMDIDDPLASPKHEEEEDEEEEDEQMEEELTSVIKIEVTPIEAPEWSGDEHDAQDGHVDAAGETKSRSRALKYPCMECEMAFTSKYALKMHFRIHNEALGDYICATCQRRFKTSKTLKHHMRFHTGENLHACHICDRKFTMRNHMLRHLQHVHAEGKAEKKSWMCPQCGKECNTKFAYERHLTVHTDVRNIQCTICTQKFKHKTALDKHIAVHIKLFECDVCQKRFSTAAALQTHTLRHQDKTVQCPYCDRAFSTEENFQNHSNKNHPGLPYEPKDGPVCCTICNELYENLEVLKCHVRIHPVVRNYECDICGTKFFEKQGMIKHIKAIHMGMKQPQKVYKEEDLISCAECERKFKTRRSYELHVSSHSDERPFGCKMCSKTFKRKKDVRSHMAVHRDQRITHPCEHCGMKFTWKSNMRRHVQDVHLKPMQEGSEIHVKKEEIKEEVIEVKDEIDPIAEEGNGGKSLKKEKKAKKEKGSKKEKEAKKDKKVSKKEKKLENKEKKSKKRKSKKSEEA